MVEDKYVIKTICYMGAQECPFQNKDLDKSYHGYEYGSTDFVINGKKDLTNKIQFNTLLVHMIKKHHFFEGSDP